MTTKDDEHALLRSAAMQNAASIRIARQRAEQRQEAYLAEAQGLSHTGSFGWNVSTGEIVWSEESFRIFQYDRTTEPTVERALERVHPEDLALVRQTLDRARREKKDFDLEHRLLIPDGSVKHLRVVARVMEDESGNVEFVGAVMDITERRRAEMLLAGEKRLLEMTARGDSRALILDALCRLVEELASGSLSSILLLDANANRLRHGAAPSLPIAYTEAIDGIVIGPSVGSCGTAAYRGEPVMVCDIATDPLWTDYRDLALAHGLRACWSTPILSSGGKVLGTFAVYYREPRSPTAQEHNLIEQITHLASIAVEREQAEEVLREQASLLDLTHDTVFVRDMNDVITYWNRGAEELYGWNREQVIGKTTHQILQTTFPEPLAEINGQLLRTGRWEGELIHTKRDATQVVVASRWALQRDARGNAAAVLETNNDITERKRNEAELLHKTALLHELFEGSPDAVVLMDLEARVLRISREFAALFGYTAEESAGRLIVDLIVPVDELEDSRAGFARVRSGERFVVERERRRKDGTRIHVSIKRAPIVLGGKPIGYYGIYRDITERKRAEEALRLSEERYALAVQASGEGHWDWNIETDEFYASPRYLEIGGFPPDFQFSQREDVVDRIAFHPEDRPKYDAAVAAHFAGATPRVDIVIRITPHADTRWLHVIGLCLRDASGKPVRWAGSVNDVTARMRAEEALRLSEERYALAMLAAEDAHWDWIVGTDEYYLSPRTLELFGLPPDTVFTSREDYLARTPLVREDLENWQRAMAELFSGTGSRLSMELRAIVHGEIRWLQHIGVCMRDASGRPVRWCGTARDITERRRTEEALQRSETYLAEAQKLSRVGSWAWNAQTKQVIHWSEEQYRMLGFDPQAGMPSDPAILGRIHPSDHTRYIDDLKTAVRERKDLETHYRVCLPDFTVKYVHVVGHPVFDASGDLVEYVGSSMNVTERKRAEEALRQSEEQWKAVFEHNPTMYFMVDAQGTIVSVNSFGAAQLGYAVDELVGRAALDVFPEADRQAVQANLAACFEQLGRTMRWELRKLRKDGTTLWVRETAKAEVIKKRPVALIVCEDVTESKQARQDLRDSETRYRNIFQTVGVSIWEEDFSRVKAAIDALKDSGVEDFRHYLAANPEFVQQAISMVKVVDVNDVTVKLFAAQSKGELLASLDKVFMPETREVFVDELVALAEGRTYHEAETTVQTLTGARLTVLFTITFPRPHARARFDSVLVTITDVTEQRAREREREELQRQLQQAAKMEAIGRLAGGIAHDFNNILGAILGYGELAQKNLEGRAVRRHVDQVMLAGARGKGLVERILAFSRSGLGERVPVHVQSVVEEALEILAASLLPQVRLERQLDAGDTAVVADATQLHQVAMNLCTNALQAMEHGGVLTVALEKVAVSERRLLSHGTLLPGSYARLSVGDTGSGIPPAVLERIFDPFFTTKGIGEGTGLGLSLVHGIVADFGGAIDVATQSGAGTTFAVWLPAAGETPRILAEPAGELPQGNGETVMIVDDQHSLVALAEETLAELGYEPAGFDSSVAALQAFRAEPRRFDLVLTDETMPDLSGVELAREIRSVRPELPIVLMSGYSGAQLSERARAAGVAELLRKPLVRRDIAEALGRALRPAVPAATTAFDYHNGRVA